MFQQKLHREIKHTFMSNNIFLKLYRSWDNKAKYRRAGQATDDNMKHAHCILDTLG